MSLKSRDTLDVFIDKAKAVHGETYDYKLVQLVNDNTLVDILCKKHATIFKQSPGKHKAGRGCPTCARERTGKARQHYSDDFLRLSKKVHGENYDYSLVDLALDSDEVQIICNKHAEAFWQKPSNHKQGSGCPLCAREAITAGKRLTTAKFVEKAKSVHGDKYDYGRVNITEGGKVKVEIICPTHDAFWMSPNHHGQGRSCPKCSWEGSGYSQSKPGTFYILQHDAVTKVGITNRKVIERIKGINRDSGLDFKLHSSVFSEDGSRTRNIELQVLAWLRLHYKIVDTKFDGYTECFLDVDIDALMNFVVPIS